MKPSKTHAPLQISISASSLVSFEWQPRPGGAIDEEQAYA